MSSVDISCIEITLNYTSAPFSSSYNARILKFNGIVKPIFQIKKSLLNLQTFYDISWWNENKMFVVKIENISLDPGKIKEVLCQYIENNDYPDYHSFNILMIKKNKSNTSLELFEALSLNLNIDNDSFSSQDNIIKSSLGDAIQYKIYCGVVQFDNQRAVNALDKVGIRDMIYLYENDLLLGSKSVYTNFYNFEPLLSSNSNIIVNIDITDQQGNILNNIVDIENIPMTIMKGDVSKKSLNIKALKGMKDISLNLSFTSNDPIYQTLNPITKNIAGIEINVSNPNVGLNKELYQLYLNQYQIVATDDTLNNNSNVVSLQSLLYQDVNFFIFPQDLSGQVFNVTNKQVNIQGSQLIKKEILNFIIINVTNSHPDLLSINNSVKYPNIDSDNNLLENKANGGMISDLSLVSISSSMPGFQPTLTFSVLSNDSIFNDLLIPTLNVNISLFVINFKKSFVNVNFFERDTLEPEFNPILKYTINGENLLQNNSNLNLNILDSAKISSQNTFNFNVSIQENDSSNLFYKFVDITTSNSSAIYRSDGLTNSFNVIKGDKLIFNMSDNSLFNHNLQFFIDPEMTINLDTEFIFRTRLIEPGTPGSIIELTVPSNLSAIYYQDDTNNNWSFSSTSLTSIPNNQINIIDETLTDVGEFTALPIHYDGSTYTESVIGFRQDNFKNYGVSTIIPEINQTLPGEYQNEIISLINSNQNFVKATVNAIDLTKPVIKTTSITSGTIVTISWKVLVKSSSESSDYIEKDEYDFANPLLNRETIYIKYEVYRQASTESSMSLLGTTTNTSFVDTTALGFTNYNYFIKSIATWEGLSLSSKLSDGKFIFVCEDITAFPHGRWNNTRENTKLYKPISNNCAIVEKMNPDPSFTTTTYYSNTGLLFTNSLVLTKKGIYKFLSEGTRRPNR